MEPGMGVFSTYVPYANLGVLIAIYIQLLRMNSRMVMVETRQKDDHEHNTTEHGRFDRELTELRHRRAPLGPSD